ncbi:MAG TPA: L-threonylcarbamoyladenylate synthase [Anaerolineaceae bacterium]
MKTEILPASEPQAQSHALAVLQEGGLVAFPTDTVYGVGAMAFNAAAVQAIYTAKDRPAEKAIPVLIGDPSDLEKVSLEISPVAAKLAACFWPGGLTLVVTKHPDLPEAVSASATVGVRIPDHPIARALLRASGPLAVTSANLSGQPNPSTAGEVLAQLGGRIALIIDGGKTAGGVPSTVVDCTETEPRILRDGPVKKEMIQSCLHGDF